MSPLDVYLILTQERGCVPFLLMPGAMLMWGAGKNVSDLKPLMEKHIADLQAIAQDLARKKEFCEGARWGCNWPPLNNTRALPYCGRVVKR